MPHDPANLQHAFISDRDPGDETDALTAPAHEPEHSHEGNGNGSRSSYSALARNRAPFPAGF